MKILESIWDWVDDSPEHVAVFALICIFVAFFWKTLLGIAFWYLVFPGSFALTYAAWRWYKLRIKG